MKIGNKFGNRYSGTLGKDVVASSWNGVHYLREYKIPRDPKSELQMQHRALWAKAVERWHVLSEVQREFYNEIAVGMTGYNLFIRRYFESAQCGREPEVPRRIAWITADGRPIPGGRLRVLKDANVIFDRNLKEAEVEIALTPSDAPYTVFLMKGLREDKVQSNCGSAFIERPPTLESRNLEMTLLVTDIPVESPGFLPRVPPEANNVAACPPKGSDDVPAVPSARLRDSTGT